jgi:RNA polymerase sigma factor (sigma-70 family)
MLGCHAADYTGEGAEQSMNRNLAAKPATASVALLRKLKPDGSAYDRRTEVEAELILLVQLPPSEVALRAKIEDASHPGYLPTECLVYFVRRLDPHKDSSALHDLFNILRQRVLKAVPVFKQRLAGSNKVAERAFDLDVRDAVLHRFQELLCRDRREYDARLDFFESQFNLSLARLRSTARRDVGKKEARYQAAAAESDSGETYEDVEAALAILREDSERKDREFYRSRLQVAISSLPPDERRVIELILEGLPHHSIAKVLKCVEQTVRNRRDRAVQKLRIELMKEVDA